MKIALVCQPVQPVPPIRGGAIEIYIDGILPYLAKDHQVTVFSISDPKLPMRSQEGNVTFIRFPKQVFDQLLHKELHKNTFAVIHVFNRPKAVARYKKLLPKSRFVTSLHGEKFHKKRMTDEQVTHCKKAVDAIVTVSDYIKNTVIKRDPSLAIKTHTLYAGADPERFLPKWNEKGMTMRKEWRKKLNLQNKKVVLFTGQLTRKKGAHILLEAIRHMVKKDPSVHLLVVGSAHYGSEEESGYVRNLKKLAKKMKKQITFTGFLPPAEIPRYFAASDLFVCASQWQEPVARVHYEAMGAGLPIITTNRGGNAEVIRHKKNGLVIDDYQNPKAFFKAIDSILKQKDKARKMAKRARRDAENFYNWERVSKELLDHYSE